MKLLIATLSIFVSLMSCNSNDKNISKVEIVKIQKDTLKIPYTPNQRITKAFVLGKFDYKTDTTFIRANTEHSAKMLYLNKQVYQAFLKMQNAAVKDGITLTILSGTRNFNEQKAIWERKWKKYSHLKPTDRAKKILEYSAMPSTSRHHWGTDLDLNSLSNSYFSSGKGKTIFNWLTKNANTFGFYQVYTNKTNGRTGYKLEKWHWSYLPLASQYLKFYNKNIVYDDINNFIGYEEAINLNVINDYVNGISQKAKNNK